MATYGVPEEKLTAIANAIRMKTDDPAEMSVDDMPMQIGLIEGGSEVRKTTVVHEIPWTTTSAGGNTQTFYETYVPTDDGWTIVIIKNTLQSGNCGQALTCIRLGGVLQRRAYRSINYTATDGFTAGYDFFIGAGSTITIYHSAI